MLIEPPNPQSTSTHQSRPQHPPLNQTPKAAITPSTHTYRLFTLLKSVLSPGRATTPDSVEQREPIIMIRARHCKHRATPFEQLLPMTIAATARLAASIQTLR